MRTPCRFLPFVFVGLLGGAMACGGGDSSGPKTAASVTGVSGDNQTGPTGGQLEFPLSMVLLGSNGQPVQGVTVAWSVSTGTATLSQLQDTSDVNGAVSTSVTLGAQVGAVVARATVPGVASPTDYHLTVVKSCSYVVSHTVPGTVHAILTSLDCNLGALGWYYDFYEVTPTAQQGVTTSMTAVFDTYLELYEVRDTTLYQVGGNNNAEATTTNSAMKTITSAGTFMIGASTNFRRDTGAYTLTTATRPQALSGCADEVYVTRGISIADNIATTDCADTTAGGVFYSDQAGIILFAGTVVTISQHSTAFNPFLTLFEIGPTGPVAVASNDDSSTTNTDAFIQFPVTEAAVYVVVPGTSTAAQTGAYTLTISPSLTASAPVLAATPRRTVIPQFLRQAPWRPMKIQARPLPKL